MYHYQIINLLDLNEPFSFTSPFVTFQELYTYIEDVAKAFIKRAKFYKEYVIFTTYNGVIIARRIDE